MYSSFSQQVWKPKTSVKLRFSLAQGFFIAIVISLLALTLYFPVRNRFVSITDNSYKLLAETLSSSMYDAYQKNDLESVSVISRRAIQQGVKYVLVVDADNRVYYDSISGQKSLEKQSLTDKLNQQVAEGKIEVVKTNRDGEVFYNYVAPFIVNNQVAYTVRVGVTQQTIDGEFNRLASLFLYLAAFGVIVGIVASYILAAKLTKPIILLTESALAIRAGNLNAFPQIETGDELEQLAREFHSMVERLKQFYFQEYTQKKEALVAKGRLEEVNSRLHELDQQKTDFLNAASHQLRTPLSVIHWSLSLILESAPTLNLTKEQLELIKESLKSTKRMVDLINDLLDISRIEQGRKELAWEKSNFATVCEQLVNALQLLAKNKNLALTFEKIGFIPDSYLDEKAFYQVINNFVDNAIKYTVKGFVKVVCESRDTSVVIKIADSGIGMTEGEKKTLFSRFNRGTEAKKLFPNGSGLGMYVANRILQQHGGTVEVKSEKGQGTIFILTLPLRDKLPDEHLIKDAPPLVLPSEMKEGLAPESAQIRKILPAKTVHRINNLKPAPQANKKGNEALPPKDGKINQTLALKPTSPHAINSQGSAEPT